MSVMQELLDICSFFALLLACIEILNRGLCALLLGLSAKYLLCVKSRHKSYKIERLIFGSHCVPCRREPSGVLIHANSIGVIPLKATSVAPFMLWRSIHHPKRTAIAFWISFCTAGSDVVAKVFLSSATQIWNTSSGLKDLICSAGRA